MANEIAMGPSVPGVAKRDPILVVDNVPKRSWQDHVLQPADRFRQRRLWQLDF